MEGLVAKFVAYYRVSTERQGRSGLGLAAQRTKIEAYISATGELIAEFCDISRATASTFVSHEA